MRSHESALTLADQGALGVSDDVRDASSVYGSPVTASAVTVIDCSGTGTERGLAHGESLREQVRDSIARWSDATLSSVGAATSIEHYCAEFLRRTSLLEAMERETPDLLDEVRGIALGAGVAVALVAAYNLMDEQWWHDLPGESAAQPGCSLVARASGDGMLLAQNMDLPAWMDGSQVVLRLSPPERPQVLVLTSAGMIGLVGASSAGFAVGVNTLLMLRHDRAGLPVAAAMRAALAADSAADAVTRLRSVTHASGQHYAVADRSGVTGLECSAGGAVVSHPTSRTPLSHTNHPLVSTDIDPDKQRLLSDGGRLRSSHDRLAVVTSDARVGGSSADVGALLRDPTTSVCMRASSASSLHTFASVRCELGAQTRTTIRFGTADAGGWQDLTFTS